MHAIKFSLICLLVIASSISRSAEPVNEADIAVPDDETQEEVKPKFYRKVNPDGSVEFSDVPTKGAAEVKLEPVPTTKITPAGTFTPYQPPSAVKKFQYNRFEIVSPVNDAAIRDNAGNISIQAVIDPPLHREHKIVWSLDGGTISSQSSLILKLFDVERGSHTVVAKILTDKEEILQQTPVVTFHMKRFFKKPVKPPAPKKPAP